MAVKKESKHHHIWKNVFIQKCKLGTIKNVQVFETLCRHRPQVSPNNWKHHREKDMEIQGPVPPETDSSPFRIFEWLLQASTSVSSLQFVDSSGQKESWFDYICNFSWKSVKRKSSKMYELMAQHLATGDHGTLVSVRWPWFHGGAWELRTPIVRLQKQLTPFRTGKPPSALPPIAHTDLEERH